MLIIFSHILAFSSLFLASVFDLYTSEVPDSVSVAGVVGGVLLHAAASWNQMEPGVLFSAAVVNAPLAWAQSLGEPLLWCLSVGAIFSIYGWGLYFLGMWGGADAFAMSVLGFAAPYSIAGPGFGFLSDLFINILIVGFLYTLGFAFYRAGQHPEVFRKTRRRLHENRVRVSLEFVFAAAFSTLMQVSGAPGLFYFGSFAGLILLYHFLKVIQEEVMVREIPASELEGGEVIDFEEEEIGRNKIRGVREEELGEIESETVEVHEGVKFVPVFCVALVLTEIGFGLKWFVLLIN